MPWERVVMFAGGNLEKEAPEEDLLADILERADDYL